MARGGARVAVPIGSVATFNDTTGPYRVARYNLYPAAEVQVALQRGMQAVEQRLVDAVGQRRVEQRGDVVQPGRQALEQKRLWGALGGGTKSFEHWRQSRGLGGLGGQVWVIGRGLLLGLAGRR